jgi:putative glutamine amidotransferase
MENRPIIGVTSDVRIEKRTLSFVFSSYYECVERAGGLPLQIPPLEELDLVSQILATVDGFVIVGGEDLDPDLYGEKPLPTHQGLPRFRERFDLELARRLLRSDHPALGICLGCQLLTVASGGALYQHIPDQIPGALCHSGRYPDLPTHPIEVVAGSRLRGILGADRLTVNSAHHQAVRRLGRGFVVSATAPDGVIEAFEAPGDRFLLGVEWHPDLMAEAPEQRRIFEALVDAARVHASARSHA